MTSQLLVLVIGIVNAVDSEYCCNLMPILLYVFSKLEAVEQYVITPEMF